MLLILLMQQLLDVLQMDYGPHSIRFDFSIKLFWFDDYNNTVSSFFTPINK